MRNAPNETCNPICRANVGEFEQCPAELRAIPNWVTWNYEPTDSVLVEPKKILYTPGTHYRAQSNTPSTWRSFAEAVLDYQHNARAGLGFVFEEKLGFVFIDLQEWRDPDTGEADNWAAKKMRLFNSYTEISHTGIGAHIIVRATKPKGDYEFLLPNGNEVGVYCHQHFSPITGIYLDDLPRTIEPRQNELYQFYAELLRFKAAELRFENMLNPPRPPFILPMP
ncbi:MAG: hypothetical protein KA118_07975 [Verrucomicrobia bacterium]|nr:hypothetical protein [Verrucomicrobiota bacterium]